MNSPGPYHLAAVAALSSLRQAYPHLAELTEAEAYQRRDAHRGLPRRHDSARVAAQAAQLRQERADRIHSHRSGIHTPGTTLAPVRASLLDAQIRAQVTVEAVCWDAADLLRVIHPRSNGTRGIRYSGWDTRCDYLDKALRQLPPEHARRAAQQLQRADAAVRAALGIGPDRRLLPGDPPCPACGRTTLRAEVSSLDERDWTISCAPDCRCTGVQCACHRPNRTPDDPHLWPVEEYANNFGELRGYLRAMQAVEAGAITRDGVVYATADQLARVLDGGVTPRILRDWRRCGLVDAIRVGRSNWYRLDQVYAANKRTQDHGRPRKRSAA